MTLTRNVAVIRYLKNENVFSNETKSDCSQMEEKKFFRLYNLHKQIERDSI
jgi:hypothetical protein